MINCDKNGTSRKSETRVGIIKFYQNEKGSPQKKRFKTENNIPEKRVTRLCRSPHLNIKPAPADV